MDLTLFIASLVIMKFSIGYCKLNFMQFNFGTLGSLV